MKDHRCIDDLANLRPHAADYLCTCGALVYLREVVEALRSRSVARDAAERLRDCCDYGEEG